MLLFQLNYVLIFQQLLTLTSWLTLRPTNTTYHFFSPRTISTVAKRTVGPEQQLFLQIDGIIQIGCPLATMLVS